MGLKIITRSILLIGFVSPLWGCSLSANPQDMANLLKEASGGKQDTVYVHTQKPDGSWQVKQVKADK